LNGVGQVPLVNSIDSLIGHHHPQFRQITSAIALQCDTITKPEWGLA
jgi:hypothetical protein